ncbi:hypothetical protein [Novosphingobium sp. BL-52-GroH]|uniref:hypothetical protein n=1 Tax=Novosphingobium sp. BL-52-GroH TaxID=3349877 RepID=UPI00384FC610
MCDDTGYKDHGGFAMDPCHHTLPTRSDPMEAIIAAALTAAGLQFAGETENPARLDFLLEGGIYIEVKRMHSPRIAEQMSRAPNVIAVQGEDAVRWLAARLTAPTSEIPADVVELVSAARAALWCNWPGFTGDESGIDRALQAFNDRVPA